SSLERSASTGRAAPSGATRWLRVPRRGPEPVTRAPESVAGADDVPARALPRGVPTIRAESGAFRADGLARWFSGWDEGKREPPCKIDLDGVGRDSPASARRCVRRLERWRRFHGGRARRGVSRGLRAAGRRE